MNNEKMREEFEAWHSSTYGWLPRHYDFYWSEDRYLDEGFQRDWECWIASRAAVVVELPKIVGYEGAYDSLQDHEFCPRMTDVDDADEVFGLCRSMEVQDAIEAAGLNWEVKP